MNLKAHQRTALMIFWFAQAVGVATVLLLVLFIGGNVISELFSKAINFKDDYGVIGFFLAEILLALSFVISWYRKRRGPILIIVITVLTGIVWGGEQINIILMHLPALVSGVLLLFYSYYKEWILKKKA